ncbi:MAG: DUF61 family protein [Candidatus Methanoperedens sp.]|nr:DUF61 family protein [Candidatus Methanoperedens sp.]MCZ7396582.1 DUF61 family protein [Candidatus Methanoperedens sp.]
MLREDDFEKKISLRFLQTLNRHLPKKRRTLKELLLEDIPDIKNLDGSTHSFDKKELEKLASIVPEWEHDKLRLPIYLEMSSSMERGTIKISGRLECRIINRVLHEDEKPEKRSLEEQDSMTIYYPHLPKIRKELSTTTQYMFTM